MITSCITHREKLKLADPINLLWTPSNGEFEKFIRYINCNLIDIHQLYYGSCIPDLIVCNDKVENHSYCYNLSRKLHLPVLLIDHIEKNPIYDSSKISLLNHFSCYHHVCISKKISDTWELKNVQVLSYNINDKDNILIWKNLIFQTAKKLFKI